MVVGREADRVPIPMPPTERLDCARIVERGPQCGSVTNTLPDLVRLRVHESRNRGARRLYPKRLVAAGCYQGAQARWEYILAQGDVLTGDIRLMRPTAIIETDDPAIGGRALRPVDPVTLERELLGRMVPGRQAGDKRGHSSLRVDLYDARTAVLPTCVGCLIRVGREEKAALEIALEGDIDRRPCWLEPDAGSRRLAKWSCDFITPLVEHKDIGREWVIRRELSAGKRILLVAFARQAMTRFEHINLEIVLVAHEGDASRHVQSAGEDRDREARRHDDILAVPRIEKSGFNRTKRIRDRRRRSHGTCAEQHERGRGKRQPNIGRHLVTHCHPPFKIVP